MAKAATKQPVAAPAPLTDREKIQLIYDSTVLHRAWYGTAKKPTSLTCDEKRQILDGMDAGIDERWILSLIDDVVDARRSV